MKDVKKNGVDMGSHILREYEYLEPNSLSEALTTLTTYKVGSKILAGGTDLLVSMKLRKIQPKYIINIGKISDLNYIKKDKKGLKIGALTTLRAIEKSEVIFDNYLALYDAAHAMGTVQTRYMGTIGGNLCNASPAADMAPPLLALNAILKIESFNCERTVPVEDFFLNPGKTILRDNELLTEIQVPNLARDTRTAFQKIGRVSGDLSKVNVAVALTVHDGICENVNISLGAVAPKPIRARITENFLKGKKLKVEIIEKGARMVAEEIQPISDIRSTAEYRKEASIILVKRVINKCLKEPKKEKIL